MPNMAAESLLSRGISSVTIHLQNMLIILLQRIISGWLELFRQASILV